MVSRECVLQVVVAVVIKEKWDSPRELGRGRMCPCVSIPSLVDDLSSRWMNGMLMQMLDPVS